MTLVEVFAESPTNLLRAGQIRGNDFARLSPQKWRHGPTDLEALTIPMLKTSQKRRLQARKTRLKCARFDCKVIGQTVLQTYGDLMAPTSSSFAVRIFITQTENKQVLSPLIPEILSAWSITATPLFSMAFYSSLSPPTREVARLKSEHVHGQVLGSSLRWTTCRPINIYRHAHRVIFSLQPMQHSLYLSDILLFARTLLATSKPSSIQNGSW